MFWFPLWWIQQLKTKNNTMRSKCTAKNIYYKTIPIKSLNVSNYLCNIIPSKSRSEDIAPSSSFTNINYKFSIWAFRHYFSNIINSVLWSHCRIAFLKREPSLASNLCPKQSKSMSNSVCHIEIWPSFNIMAIAAKYKYIQNWTSVYILAHDFHTLVALIFTQKFKILTCRTKFILKRSMENVQNLQDVRISSLHIVIHKQ